MNEVKLVGPHPPRLSSQTFALEMAEAWYNNYRSEWVPLSRSAGKVSAAFVIPYPPGSPLLIPGQIISDEVVEFLSFIIELGGEVLGVHENKVRVLKGV
jgi:arginine/lysine/ornithine decarboxylase